MLNPHTCMSIANCIYLKAIFLWCHSFHFHCPILQFWRIPPSIHYFSYCDIFENSKTLAHRRFLIISCWSQAAVLHLGNFQRILFAAKTLILYGKSWRFHFLQNPKVHFDSGMLRMADVHFCLVVFPNCRKKRASFGNWLKVIHWVHRRRWPFLLGPDSLKFGYDLTPLPVSSQPARLHPILWPHWRFLHHTIKAPQHEDSPRNQRPSSNCDAVVSPWLLTMYASCPEASVGRTPPSGHNWPRHWAMDSPTNQ